MCALWWTYSCSSSSYERWCMFNYYSLLLYICFFLKNNFSYTLVEIKSLFVLYHWIATRKRCFYERKSVEKFNWCKILKLFSINKWKYFFFFSIQRYNQRQLCHLRFLRLQQARLHKWIFIFISFLLFILFLFL